MSSNWYFFYQQRGKEDTWTLTLSTERQRVITDLRPAFSTILDLSAVPDDADWSKVRYRGPLYFDFDADGDLDLACEQFKNFLGKLDAELGFDITQARLYASGSKGFHIEIPQECFLPKPPTAGVPWLAYIYAEMAKSLVVDTLDFAVYTGKRGRQWRTANVKRENGMYKVPLTVEDALTVTPELYAQLISEPRLEPARTPPICNTQFAVLYERSKSKVVDLMRGKKKRQEKANTVLDPWKKAQKTPPSIEKIMAGEDLAEGAGFQSIAMQLAIYAVSVAMPLPEFLDRCKGLIENHVSDGTRYSGVPRRRAELQRMWEYMGDNNLYDFDTGPMVRLLKAGTPTPDLGVMVTEDHEDMPPQAGPAETDTEDGDTASTSVATPAVGVDTHRGVRKGFFMNADGMWRKTGDQVDSVCRATLRKVESFYDIEKMEFKGYEFDILVAGRPRGRAMLSGEAFTSAALMRKFFVAHQLTFQGGDPDANALLDVMAEKAGRGGKVYTYPREGFFIINNPESDHIDPVKVYLTQDTYMCSVKEDDPNYFRLRYKPGQVASSYAIDIHKAPDLDESMIPAIHDLFAFSRDNVVADLLGWFVACHYRSAYLHLFKQFPLLQIYGEAGAGKTQSVLLLSHLHWFMKERISVNSATSCTNYTMDAHASTSTSAPFILDEYKPRELRNSKDKYAKLKDVLKACYVGADIGNRGTVNRGAENNMGIIKSKATAPIVFMGEAIEMETAIIERSVCINFSKSFITKRRKEAFERLQADPTALSALGRAIVEMGFALNLDTMRKDVNAIKTRIEESLPDFDDENRKRAAPRLIFNRTVIIHALTTLRHVLHRAFGDEFDASIDALLNVKSDAGNSEDTTVMTIYGMSEISKVISRIALLSRDIDTTWEMRKGIDYIVDDGWVEIKVERSYDCYRRYCASIHDTPLFDNLDAFFYALQAYSPCIDKQCAASSLRGNSESSERIVRLDTRALNREGIQSFRD